MRETLLTLPETARSFASTQLLVTALGTCDAIVAALDEGEDPLRGTAQL